MSAHHKRKMNESDHDRIRRAYRLWVIPGMMTAGDLCKRFQITRRKLQQILEKHFA